MPRKILRVAGPILLIGLLAGCLLPPEPKTDAGKDVFNLYLLVLALAAIVFVGVEGFLLYAIVRYRRRPGDETLPVQHHGNTMIEIVWTAIPTVIVMVLFIFSMITLTEVEARAEDPVRIEVEGFQWQWTFRYPDGPSVTGTAAEPPTLRVPVGEPVRLVLISTDVNHSFYVPDFLIKRDLIPMGDGTANELEFTVSEPGTYSGQCAEFCGAAHADMIFTVEAMERADYDAFLAGEAEGEAPAPTDGEECGVTVEIAADDLEFDIDSFEVPADTEFCIQFDNQESVPHNVAIYDGEEAIFSGEILNTEGSVTYRVPGLAAGDYRFICEVHPTDMVGDVTVTQ